MFNLNSIRNANASSWCSFFNGLVNVSTLNALLRCWMFRWCFARKKHSPQPAREKNIFSVLLTQFASSVAKTTQERWIRGVAIWFWSYFGSHLWTWNLVGRELALRLKTSNAKCENYLISLERKIIQRKNINGLSCRGWCHYELFREEFHCMISDTDLNREIVWESSQKVNQK